MLISSKGRYALRLMIYIAAFGDAEGKIALREVADREDISLKYLEQLVRPLMHAGLLTSVRGKGGGYALARPADEIRAGDILRAAEGTTAPVACEGLEGACHRGVCGRGHPCGPCARARDRSEHRLGGPRSRADWRRSCFKRHLCRVKLSHFRVSWEPFVRASRFLCALVEFAAAAPPK